MAIRCSSVVRRSLMCGSLAAVMAAPAWAQVTSRESISSLGAEATGPAGFSSEFASVSDDGRWVAFVSTATNLLDGSPMNVQQVYLRDRRTGQTRIVSQFGGIAGNAPSYLPQVSSNGDFVVFYSDASNLITQDSNGFADCFLWTRATGAIELISKTAAGAQGIDDSLDAAFYPPAITPDGRFVAFASYASNLAPGGSGFTQQVYVRDRQTNTVERVSRASGASGAQGLISNSTPGISADGRFVCFRGLGNNLLGPGNDTNSVADIFVRDRQTNATERVSVASGTSNNQSIGGSESCTISADGRYVCFASTGINLVPDDFNQVSDVFVRDRQTNTTTRVSVNSAGVEGNFVSDSPRISSSGRYIVFLSASDNLVDSDVNQQPDIFRHDLQTHQTILVSVATGGQQGNGSSEGPSVSTDGNVFAFESVATNLIADDTNAARDIFVRDLLATPPAAGCNLADITGIGGPPAIPDGLLTGDDFNAFISAFAAGEPLADVTGIGGPPAIPDGLITGDDFNAFISAFAGGCP